MHQDLEDVGAEHLHLEIGDQLLDLQDVGDQQRELQDVGAQLI
jgi:hypothetical protein